MKSRYMLIGLSFSILLLSSCVKDYSCTAINGTEEKIFNCENCSKKDIEAYEKKIIEKGWASVQCEK